MPTDEQKRELQRNADIPNRPTDLTYDARMAVAHEGPMAGDWQDKPHRVVYDLCRHIEALSAAEGVKPRKGALINALRSYQQADMDGVMCIVSRQAVEEAISALEGA